MNQIKVVFTIIRMEGKILALNEDMVMKELVGDPQEKRLSRTKIGA